MNNTLFQSGRNFGVNNGMKEVTEKTVTTNEALNGREIVTRIREEKKLVLETEPSVQSITDYQFN
jgi:hypothetical protein